MLGGEGESSGPLLFNTGLCSRDDHGVDMTTERSVCGCPENSINCPHCSFIYAGKLSTSSRWILIIPKCYCPWNSQFHSVFNSMYTLGLKIWGRRCSSVFIFIKMLCIYFDVNIQPTYIFEKIYILVFFLKEKYLVIFWRLCGHYFNNQYFSLLFLPRIFSIRKKREKMEMKKNREEK